MEPFMRLCLPLFMLAACSNSAPAPMPTQLPSTGQQPDLSGTSVAHFAEGCFWCSEEIFQHVRGVKAVINGYAGGHVDNPSYEQVCTGTTGHAETVEVYYNPTVVSFETLVKVFFASQDPTTPSRQGPDAGPQYRSIAFYDTPEQKAFIDGYIKQLDASGQYDAPIVTEVSPFIKFWRAEDHHQDFVDRNPDHGYVRSVSKPRFERFRERMPDVLKDTLP